MTTHYAGGSLTKTTSIAQVGVNSADVDKPAWCVGFSTGRVVDLLASTMPTEYAQLVPITWAGADVDPAWSNQATKSWDTPGTKWVTAHCGDSFFDVEVHVVAVTPSVPESPLRPGEAVQAATNVIQNW